MPKPNKLSLAAVAGGFVCGFLLIDFAKGTARFLMSLPPPLGFIILLLFIAWIFGGNLVITLPAGFGWGFGIGFGLRSQGVFA